MFELSNSNFQLLYQEVQSSINNIDFRKDIIFHLIRKIQFSMR